MTVDPHENKLAEADMSFYYERLLPFRHLFQWLSHSPKTTNDFTLREFAFEYRSKAYSRYNSYGSVEEFKRAVVQANPNRFEVGAVYAVRPKDRKILPKAALKPVSKELVFDIDMDDYKFRTCCEGKRICEKCWRLIQVAIKVMDAALKEDFGFKHILWVFSGRRGAHCWVSDARARNLNDTTRRSILEYFDVLGFKRFKNGSQRLQLKRPFHPHIERSFKIMKHDFIDIILDEQDPWRTNQTEIEELLSFMPDKALQEELRSKWKGTVSSSRQKWEDINVVAKRLFKNQAQVNQLNEAKKEIIIFYLYPRLDEEVSKQTIHLLKSPFCVHPDTGNVCVPFDPTKNFSSHQEDDEYGFNPMHVPNLRMLQNETEAWNTRRIDRESSPQLDDSENENDATRRVHDYEKTSLKPYVEYFARYISNFLKDELKGVAKRERDDSLDF